MTGNLGGEDGTQTTGPGVPSLVLGSRGRLGRSLLAALGPDARAPGRAEYSDWWTAGSSDRVAAFLRSAAPSPGIVLVACGVVDPAASPQDHERVNVLLPRNVIEGASKAGWRAVTFGTIMETMQPEHAVNSYIASKIRLGRFVSEFHSATPPTHVRMHTHYGGGPPPRFMFLGQMLACLAARTPFRMSSGLQLREYHFVDDDARAILKIVATGLHGIAEVSHGEPVRLRDLAGHVFEAFGCTELLQVGALPLPAHENIERTFERSPLLRDLTFRRTLPSVVEHLRSCLAPANAAGRSFGQEPGG
jgi:nucleoside-diphosphate-sugar epimerase